MSVLTRSQVYSKKVFDIIQNYVQDNSISSDEKKSYKSLCKRSGGILRTIGLIQFLTFVESKGKKDHHYAKLMTHLREGIQITGIVSTSSPQFLEIVRNQELTNYMNTTKDILRLLQWHKRIADILIEGNCEEEGT